MTMNKTPPAEATVLDNSKKKLLGPSLVNKSVRTAYGTGSVLEYRTDDEVYVIQLLFDDNTSSSSPRAILYTQEPPERIKTAQDEINELNVAYEALEKMRRMNLEMECFETGIAEVNFDQCTTCLLTRPQEQQSRFPRLQKLVDNAKEISTESTKFSRIRMLRGSILNKNSENNKNETPATTSTTKKSVVLPRIQKFMDDRQKATASPCLICASPSCSAHSSSNFRKEGITVCFSCERLFELTFIVECVSTPNITDRAKHIDHMIDCYDRCLLLLRYSSQYVEQIAISLDLQKEKQNKIGLGSSGVGVLSGVLGIAAAATILTPVGPPLMIASLFFGGSATAVQTGTEAYNYFSEPNKLADRIIALHGMILSLLRVTSTLRDAMLRDHIRTDVFEAEPTSLKDQVQDKLEKNRTGVLAGANFGRTMTLGTVGTVTTVEAGAVAGAEVGAMAGARGATTLSRVGTATARTVSLARFAGGALSAAVLVLEANAIQSTLKSIKEGSPCDKAKRIREIAQEIKVDALPSTSELDEECQAYLTALANRPTPPPEVAAEVVADVATNEFPEAECSVVPSDSGGLASSGTLILDGEDHSVPGAATANSVGTRSSGGSSLFERIQKHQRNRREQQSMMRSEEVIASVVEGDNCRNLDLSLIS